MTFSVGPQGRTQVTKLSIHQTSSGDIYIDDFGSRLKRWEPENGIVEVKNVFGVTIMFKRQAPAIVYQPSTIGSTYGFRATNPSDFGFIHPNSNGEVVTNQIDYGFGSTNSNEPPAYSQQGFSNPSIANKH